MGKYLKRFKDRTINAAQHVAKVVNAKMENKSSMQKSMEEDFPDDDFPESETGNYNEFYDPYDEPGIPPAQKPESFHHYILENQYKDLERSIRGFKDVYNKDTQKWEIKRKKTHCFTDEEAEEILRTAQSHLATDIKLSYISKDAFPLLMDAIYKEIAFLFESIAEYRYGRYMTDGKPDPELQYQMKLQNHKIFLELFTRIQANYSRAIQGQENKFTHESVKTQESLQQIDPSFNDLKRYS